TRVAYAGQGVAGSPAAASKWSVLPPLRVTSAATGAPTAAVAMEPAPASFRNVLRFIPCMASFTPLNLDMGSAQVRERTEVVGVGADEIGGDSAIGDERELDVDHVVLQLTTVQEARRA